MPAIVNSNNVFLGSNGGGASVHYTAGPNIDITENIISGKDWSDEIENASSYAYEQATAHGVEYSGIAPIDVNNTTHEISADVWTLSGTSGISILEDSENKVTTIAYTAQPDLSNYYTKNETSSKQEISAALSNAGNVAVYTDSALPNSTQLDADIAAGKAICIVYNGRNYWFDLKDTNYNYYYFYAVNAYATYLYYLTYKKSKNSWTESFTYLASENYVKNYTAYSSLSAQTLTGAVLDYTYGNFRTLSSNEIKVNDSYVIPKTKYYNVHETVIHSADGGTATTNDLSTNFVYNNVYATVTGQIDPQYRNYTFGNNGEYIGYDTRIDVTLPVNVTRVDFTACTTDYRPIYTGMLTSNEPKSEWTIEPTDFNIDHSNAYYSNQFAKIQIEFGSTGVITAKLINAVDEVFATQPWVLSQLTGQGAGFPITGMDGSTVYSADCNGSSFNIRSQYSTTYFAPRSLYHAHSPAYGASAEYSDIIDVANTFVTAIPAQVVANSGMATGQNILYIVTGN